MFALDIVATDSDMDELEHVSNVVYVRWILEVAQEHSVACGYDHAAYRDLGAVFVVRRHEIDYLRPVFAGDRIRLSTWVDSWKGASCIRATRITRLSGLEAQDGAESGSDEEAEVARARTQWAFIDMASGRPIRIPSGIRAVFQREDHERAGHGPPGEG